MNAFWKKVLVIITAAAIVADVTWRFNVTARLATIETLLTMQAGKIIAGK